MPTINDAAHETAFATDATAAAAADRRLYRHERDVAAALRRGPVMRTIGRPAALVPNAAELARLAVADTRTAHDRVLDAVADRLAAVVAEPRRPALRLVRDDGR